MRSHVRFALVIAGSILLVGLLVLAVLWRAGAAWEEAASPVVRESHADSAHEAQKYMLAGIDAPEGLTRLNDFHADVWLEPDCFVQRIEAPVEQCEAFARKLLKALAKDDSPTCGEIAGSTRIEVDDDARLLAEYGQRLPWYDLDDVRAGHWYLVPDIPLFIVVDTDRGVLYIEYQCRVSDAGIPWATTSWAETSSSR
jgi:hypothetical protein